MKISRFFTSILTCLIIFTACTALAFLLAVSSLSYNINSQEDFAHEDQFETINATVLDFRFYENYCLLELKHNKDTYNISFDISGQNFVAAKQNGLTEDSLAEDDSVTIITAKNYVGMSFSHTIVDLKVGETSYLDYETGQANLYQQQLQTGQQSAKILLVTGVLFGFFAISLTTALLVLRRKKIKAKQAEKAQRSA